MLERLKEVYKSGTSEIVEKKSRFITSVYLVKTEEEAAARIEMVKKQYWNASHNCSAYVIGLKNEIMRYNDDGEPSGTAGKPILDVITGAQIHNVLIIVTRYFGGTLLGTGGLVRAYTRAAKEGLCSSIIIEKRRGQKLRVTTDYTGIGKIQYIAGEMNLKILHSEYTDIVELYIVLSPNEVGSFIKKVLEATNGKAVVSELEQLYFAELDGEVLIYEDDEQNI